MEKAELPDGTEIKIKEENINRLIKNKKDDKTKEKHVCKVCFAIFPRSRDLKSHENFKHSGTDCDRCSKCNKVFADSSGLKRHIFLNRCSTLSNRDK